MFRLRSNQKRFQKASSFYAYSILSGLSDGFVFDPLSNIVLVKDSTTASNNFVGSMTQAVASGILVNSSPSTKWLLNSAGILSSGSNLRCDYGADGTALGLLIEGQRTNHILRSRDLTVSPWSKSNVTVTKEGSIRTALDVHKVLAVGAAVKILYQGGVVPNATSLTIKMKVKRGNFDANSAGHHFGVYDATAATNIGYVSVDYSTGVSTTVSGTVTSHSMTPIAGDTNAYIFTFTVAVVSGNSHYIYFGAVGNSNLTDGQYFYIGDPQVESGTYATSYIPTEASAVTRAQDNLYTLLNTIPYSATAGTLIVNWLNGPGKISHVVVALDDDSYSNRIGLWDDVSSSTIDNRISYLVSASGVAHVGSTLSLGDQDTEHKAALAWSANDFSASLDGGVAVTDNSGTIPAVTKLRYGLQNIAGPLDGHLRSVVLIPERLSDAELQARSTL